MTSGLVVGGTLALVVVILVSILGAIDRRERTWFVAGIAVFILAHVGFTGGTALGAVLAVVGLVVASASTVPLLRHSV